MQYIFSLIKRYLPWIVSWWLIYVIFGLDLFSHQTVFLLDYVPTPVRIRDRTYYLQHPWMMMIQDGLMYVLWYIRWSKIYLLSIVIATLGLGYAWWQYWESLIPSSTPPHQWSISRITIMMMMLFIFNPVFSSRMQTQPGVWLGIILLWRGCYRLLTHWTSLRFKDSIIIWLIRGGSMMTMNHASFMIVLMLTTFVLVRARALRVRLMSWVILLIVWLCNINWIIAWIIGNNEIIQWATSFSQQNIEEFMTFTHSWLGPVVTSILGYGFWGEKYGSASAPTWSNPRRRVAGLSFIILAIYGWWRLYFQSRQKSFMILIVTTCSLVLWVGVASHLFAPMIQRLYDYIPGYRGLREPHKRIGLYMIMILPLAWYGRQMSKEWVSHYLKPGRYAWLLICLMIAWAPGSFNHMYGRYQMTDYPISYELIRTDLINSWWTGTLIHLPRHSYQRCQWTNKVISNTLNSYMKPLDLIVSDNIEIWQLYSNSTSVRSHDIEEFIRTHDTAFLTKHKIQWILYTNQCADFPKYEWIMDHTWLQVVADRGDIQVLQIISS